MFPVEKRSEIDDDYWEREVTRRLNEYKLLDFEYEIWERESITNRSDIKTNYWSDFVVRRCAEWWGYDLREQIDNCYIPKEKLEYWDLMRDLRNHSLLLLWQG